jgi:hypothetical protein
VVKSNPDAPQLPVRARALADGKLPYMAVPRLTDERPFILLDPGRLEASTTRRQVTSAASDKLGCAAQSNATGAGPTAATRPASWLVDGRGRCARLASSGCCHPPGGHTAVRRGHPCIRRTWSDP